MPPGLAPPGHPQPRHGWWQVAVLVKVTCALGHSAMRAGGEGAPSGGASSWGWAWGCTGVGGHRASREVEGQGEGAREGGRGGEGGHRRGAGNGDDPWILHA